MDPVAVSLIGLAVLLVLMFLGMPVPLAMMFVGTLGIIFILGLTPAYRLVSNALFQNFSSFTLAVAPMFALMGFVANHSGLGSKLFRVADAFVGHIRGGLASAVQLACVIFGAICGSMPATIATMCSIAYPEMKKYNYHDSLSTASIAAGATVACLIPPSITFIIYGIATETSIGRLFLAGVFPGLLLMVFYVIGIAFVTIRHPEYAPRTEKTPWGQRFKLLSSGGLIEVIIVFTVSIGGMYMGFFSPTEAGGMGAFAIILITVFQRKIGLRGIIDSFLATTKLAAMVFFLIATAAVYGRFFAVSTLPRVLGAFVMSLDTPGWVIIAIIIVFYVVAGTVIDELALLLLTIPIFFPIVTAIGYDPVWYGVVMVICILIGTLLPPVGINCFIVKGILKEKVSLTTIYKGVWPFAISNFALCIVLMVFPQIALFLPNLVYG